MRLNVVRSLIKETLPTKKELQREWTQFQANMGSNLFIANGVVNQQVNANVMIDSGCAIYSLCDPSFLRKSKDIIQRIPVRPLSIQAFDGNLQQQATEVCVFNLDLDGYRERIWAYVTPLSGHDIILGNPWVIKRDVYISGRKQQLLVEGIRVNSKTNFSPQTKAFIVHQVNAAAFKVWTRRAKDSINLSTNRPQVFAASLADINKALDKLNRKDKVLNLRELLPVQFHDYLSAFDPAKANELPLYHQGLDHEIDTTREPPFSPLYNISRDKLLVLRKTLNNLLDKGFI